MNVKQPFTFLVGAALLCACGQSAAPQTPTDVQDTIPYVDRSIATTYPCNTAQAPLGSLSSRLGPDQLDHGNLLRGRLSAQATSGNSVWDLLYETKVLINELYFGYSSVDLQGLHQQTYQNFKKTFPNALSTYTISSQVDPLMDTYMNAIGDHHTYYLNASDYAAFLDSTSNAPLVQPVFGVNSWPVEGQDGAVVYDVRGDGSAYAAGLRRGDVLLSVDGTLLKRTVPSTSGDDSAQAALYSKILAAAAAKKTEVQVVVRRGSVQRTVSLTGEMLNATRYPWGEMQTDASGRKVYYLRIPTFGGSGIAQKVHDLIKQATAQGASGIVVDLRNNGGGQLREFVAAVAAFVPTQASQSVKYVDASQTDFYYEAGSVYYQQSCSTPQVTLTVTNPNLWNGKVAVLLNGASASASEMFSQDIKLGGKATLIGETTYGVGNTSTFIIPTPTADIAGGPDGDQAVSVTAGRVSVGGQPATERVQPDVNVPDDELALATTGVDTALQTAFTELLK